MSDTRYSKAASIGITKFEKSKEACMCPLCDKTPIENINGYTIPLQKVNTILFYFWGFLVFLMYLIEVGF